MIKFQNVRKTYKNSGVEALKGVSFLIDEGEFVFVIGKSGSGKSTILKCMNCEERPNEGTITIDGFPISNMSRALVPVLRRQIGMIFQDFRLIETKTVAENISFAGEIIGLSRKSLHQKVQLVLNIVGLKDKSDAYPQQLSGGEQQRVAIARAMLNNPKIIIADEPTGNLDPETSENIMGLLLDINRSGTTVIVCTHDANMVDRMKKRVIEIEGGLVVRDKEDSAYADERSEEEIPLPSLNVDFGEDGDYHSDYDEDTYNVEKPPVGDFYFGDTPSAPVPAPAAVFPDDDSYGDAEFAYGDEITDVSDLPVENEEEIEEIPEETYVPSDLVLTEPSAVDEEEVKKVIAVKEEVKWESDENAEEPVVTPVEPSEETSAETSAEAPAQVSETSVEPEELHFPSDPVSVPEPEVPSETTVDEEIEEDDSWLKAVRMDDIDLDIQEDDE